MKKKKFLTLIRSNNLNKNKANPKIVCLYIIMNKNKVLIII